MREHRGNVRMPRGPAVELGHVLQVPAQPVALAAVQIPPDRNAEFAHLFPQRLELGVVQVVGVVAQRKRLDAEVSPLLALLAHRLLQPLKLGRPVRLPFPHLCQPDEAVGITPHLLAVVLVQRAVDVVVLQNAHVHADEVHLADHAFRAAPHS